jgi:hypothetical protein
MEWSVEMILSSKASKFIDAVEQIISFLDKLIWVLKQ